MHISDLNIGPNDSHLGIVTYSSTASVDYNLDELSSRDMAKNALSSVRLIYLLGIVS